MKRLCLLLALILCLVCVQGAIAEEEEFVLYPYDVDEEWIDLHNGVFRCSVLNYGTADSDGYLRLNMYLDDRYNFERIWGLEAGEKVWVAGKELTVSKLVSHQNDAVPGGVEYEIYTKEDAFGYVVFRPLSNGAGYAVVDDWTPVTEWGWIDVNLPLRNNFQYIEYPEEETMKTGDEWSLLAALKNYGDTFLPYNTYCVMVDGQLLQLVHAPYPYGPEAPAGAQTGAQAQSAAESAEASDVIPVWKFCHARSADGLDTAVITHYVTDCETGPSPVEVSEAELESIRDIALYGRIAGKANDMSLTGGTHVYSFDAPDGTWLMSIEMYQGMIVSADGMYNYGY